MLAVVIGLVWITLCVVGAVNLRRFRLYGVDVIATVSEYKERASRHGILNLATLVYELNGVQHTTRPLGMNLRRRSRVGDTVEIVVRPDKPEHVLVKSAQGGTVWFMAVAIAAGVFILYLGIMELV